MIVHSFEDASANGLPDDAGGLKRLRNDLVGCALSAIPPRCVFNTRHPSLPFARSVDNTPSSHSWSYHERSCSILVLHARSLMREAGAAE
eukprot:3224144-Rhodomonas_salina.1